MKLKVLSVNISEKKGTIKKPVKSIVLNSKGIDGDAHAGSWHRQVSLLANESIEKFSKEAKRSIKYGEFAENITTSGILLHELKPFDRLVNKDIALEITQIGKKCHGDNCAIFQEVGNCVMPKEGIFARVIKGGELLKGVELEFVPKVYEVKVITLSDRASRGEYKDKSGPLVKYLIEKFYTDQGRRTDVSISVIPDEEEQLRKTVYEGLRDKVDLIITTGGTGIGPRDITPDVIKTIIDKEIPGIMELIRVKYGMEKPNALLSRGVAGVKDKTLIFSIPGSPKGVAEYMEEIVKILNHAFLMLHGIDGH